VKALNRTVRSYRKRRPTSELRQALQPITKWILARVGSAGLTPGPVTLHAHLEGGELECSFELYRCVAGAQGPTWSKEAEWKAKIADEREERVAGVTVPLVPTASFAYLLEDLLTFVSKVDVPPAEAAQALTPP
jgi:hypothetical protein